MASDCSGPATCKHMMLMPVSLAVDKICAIVKCHEVPLIDHHQARNAPIGVDQFTMRSGRLPTSCRSLDVRNCPCSATVAATSGS